MTIEPTIDKLTEKLQKYEEALTFYADEASWEIQWDRIGAAILHAHSPAHDDKGFMARTALQGVR